MNESTSTSPLYTHTCRLPDRTLWFGRASLYEDRVTLRGWTWRGRSHRQIPVEIIEDVEWRPVPKKPNLILDLQDGSEVSFRLESGAGLWNAKLHDLLGMSLLNKYGVSDDGEVGERADREST